MQAAISSWLNLEKIIFKAENKTIHSTNDHLWCLKFVKYCVQEFCHWERQQKTQVAVNREKRKDRTRFCSIICVFDIFVLFPAIIMKYL